MLRLTIGAKVLTAKLVQNSSTKALKELLAKGPLTIHMNDYGNFEKYGDIGHNLPTNDESITTTAGDVILSEGHLLVLYYGRNSWSFTRLGKIDATAEELKAVFGPRDVTVVVSLDE